MEIRVMKDSPKQALNSPVLKLATQSETDFNLCAERLKAFADPDRLQIVSCLMRGPKNVSELAAELNVGIVKVSHHLRVLRFSQVVQTLKQGKFVVYSLHPEVAAHIEVLGGIKSLDVGCCRLDLLRPDAGQ
jgi:DNA-binding transcriptional ArsR family regulator